MIVHSPVSERMSGQRQEWHKKGLIGPSRRSVRVLGVCIDAKLSKALATAGLRKSGRGSICWFQADGLGIGADTPTTIDPTARRGSTPQRDRIQRPDRDALSRWRHRPVIVGDAYNKNAVARLIRELQSTGKFGGCRFAAIRNRMRQQPVHMPLEARTVQSGHWHRTQQPAA